MTDKELLELAAKAVGYVPNYRYMEKTNRLLWLGQSGFPSTWGPLTDDADAFRLMVDLNIDLNHSWSIVSGDDNYPMASIHASCNGQNFFYELKESDPHAATRRAIVMVAAELAKMEEFA